jgi:hypothetical protein
MAEDGALMLAAGRGAPKIVGFLVDVRAASPLAHPPKQLFRTIAGTREVGKKVSFA